MPADDRARPDGRSDTRLRVAAMTMARDEGGMLQRWVNYYGNQLGHDNLMVIDDNSVDGSTTDLPCTVFRLPPAPWKHPWMTTRRRLVNDMARAHLVCYDVVIMTDVDEILVPDPARHSGLRGYLQKRHKRKVIAPLAVNVLHHQLVEPALDAARPVLAQRRFVKFAPGMCKPLIKRVPANWMPGFHGINAAFEVDRDLLLFHLKYYDVDSMRAVWDHRNRAHLEEERGGTRSEWPLGADELARRLSEWVHTPNLESVPEFDPTEVDLTGLIRPKRDGAYRVHGTTLNAMAHQPLRTVPSRFRQLL
jgi:hypothetical protein